MKVLFGIVGDGMGHAMRSAVLIERLIEQGHEVRIVTYGDPVDYLEERFPAVDEIWGLTMVTRNNQVDELGSVMTNVRGAVSGLPHNVKKFYEVSKDFDADLVVSDFEFFSWLYAQWNDVPVVSVANHHQLTRCDVHDDITEGYESSYRLTRGVIQVRVPWADHYMVPSFVDLPVTGENTELIPPILRQQFLDIEPEKDEHILVYQTSYSDYDFSSVLRQVDAPMRVYGIRRDIDEPVEDGNITWCPISEQEFIEDLRTARGVVASPGFKLMSEALHLGKPYFAIPIRGQFELIYNARYLDKLNYGTYGFRPSAQDLSAFANRIPMYERALEGYEPSGNDRTFEVLDGIVDRYNDDDTSVTPLRDEEPYASAAE